MQTYHLESLSDLKLCNVLGEFVTYRGRSALRLIEQDMMKDMESIAILSDSNFKDGIIETAIAGSPRAEAPMEMRGFVGIAFRVQPQGSHFEYFYIRPTNGRANDQLRRNHSTQYCSHPDFPWFRLREENPGVYESYTDLISGDWTDIKIVVSGLHAELYVNGAEQPCLIVNDLKLGESQGQIALWVGAGTEAHFSDVIIKPLE
ncbi:MAG: hypothetical protein ACXW4E_04050 [Anaerolineales bacterium]